MNKYEDKNVQNGLRKERLNLLQAIYLGYSLLYMRLSLVTGNTSWAKEENVAMMSLIALVYSIIVLIYNYRGETRQSVKTLCYGALVVNIAAFCFFISHIFF